MARDTQIIATCDHCDDDGAPDVAAVASHQISIDGGPVMEIDNCVRDEIDFRKLIRVYRERGRPVPQKEPAPPKKPKTVKAAKPKAIEAKPAEEPKEPVAEKESAEDKPRVHLICPEKHPTMKGDGPLVIAYGGRNTHATNCHNGARIWDIKWVDPAGVLTDHCTSHAECMKVNLGFTSDKGLAQHIRVCPLPRIDQADADDARRRDAQSEDH